MKKMYLQIAVLLLLFAAAMPFSGCFKDSAYQTYTIYKPLYKTLAQVRADVKSVAPEAVTAPGKMFIIGNTIFLAEKGKGVHIIDNANPSSPVNKAFIPIPANADIAVSGNTLYADCYSVLFAIDISNPLQITLTKTIGLFPNQSVANNTPIDSIHFAISGWEKKDTTVKINEPRNNGNYVYDASSNFSITATSSQSSAGQGGSMASFAVMGQHLYTVTRVRMNVVNISQPQQPVLQNALNMTTSPETLYPFGDKLFVGSATGMMIYSVANPQQPTPLGTFTHARVCDPVIADSQYAYVTLRSGTSCAGFTNQLDVVNVQNLTQPSLVKSYPLTNPHGLSKDGRWLFICDGKAGLKCFDASSANNILLKTTIPMAETYDVICFNNRAIVSAADGLYQYDYSDINNISLLSKIGLSK